MNLTIKLKLHKDLDVLNTISQYTKALNYVSTTAFLSNEKVRNPVSLHKLFYSSVRERFNLPSQTTCSVFRDVAGKYKANKRKLKQAISFKETHINYTFNKDFSLKDNVLGLSTINGRKKFTLASCPYYQNLIEQSTKFCDSTLVKDRKGNLYFCLTIEIPEPKINPLGNTMGIDLGLSKLVAISTNKGKTLVVKGGFVKDKRNKALALRKKLQAKGTRSAKNLLKKISGRETRFMRDVNYCTVKKVLNFAKQNNVSHIGIEDLSSIRRNSKLRNEQRRQLNSWSFYEFRAILEYKAKLNGFNVVALGPRYTSQACSVCGHTEKENRKTQKLFVCKSCGYSQNADINASANIEFLTRLSRSNLMNGVAVNHPDVTNDETKGLFRHLRSSLVTSQCL
jgi:IS605 OrfB family transposase